MINIKGGFNKLLKDVEESSPNLKSALSEIAPICICISIKGHQKIYLTPVTPKYLQKILKKSFAQKSEVQISTDN